MTFRNLSFFLATLVFCLAAVPSKSQEIEYSGFGDFRDPRQTGYSYEWIKDGKETEDLRSLSHSLLIVSWFQDPEGNFNTYQISGTEGYHSAEIVESFLKALYAEEHSKSVYGKLNVIIVGNNTK